MKVAAVQMDVEILDKERNLARVLANLEKAARAGAKLVVFPECVLTGYCFRSREEAGPVAEEVPGPSTEEIAAAVRSLDCTAILGLLERSADRIYNAAAVVGPEGILGTYRKLHLPCLGIDHSFCHARRPAFPCVCHVARPRRYHHLLRCKHSGSPAHIEAEGRATPRCAHQLACRFRYLATYPGGPRHGKSSPRGRCEPRG